MDQTMTGVRRFAQWGLWFGGALVLLAADWVTAQRLPAAAPHAKVQP